MNRNAGVILCGVVLTTLLSPLHALSRPATLTVTNPSNRTRAHEPVVVAWKAILALLPDATPATLVLTGQDNTPVTFQVDDLDGNGSPDELVFVTNAAAGEQRTFSLGISAASPEPSPSLFTDAQNWKRVKGVLNNVDDDDLPGNGRERSAYRFDGVGWESQLVGYRLYLDGRNAVDIQGKRKPALYWKWIGESGVDYQLDAGWGMDVLHVGPALGVGGMAFWAGDSVVKPWGLDHQRCRIIARGPVRAVVRVEYTGWQVGQDKADVTSLFTIYDGDRVTEHTILPGRHAASHTIVTGIVVHDSTDVLWRPAIASLCTVGHQSRANDTLMMAVTVPPANVIRRHDDTTNHLLLLKFVDNAPIRVLIASYWQGETGTMWTQSALEEFLATTGDRLRHPLTVRIR